MKMHLLASRNNRVWPHVVRMFCGRSGADNYGEFTPMDGIENRYDYATEEKQATCRACLAALNRAKRRE
jgi:hypothetical protein